MNLHLAGTHDLRDKLNAVADVAVFGLISLYLPEHFEIARVIDVNQITLRHRQHYIPLIDLKLIWNYAIAQILTIFNLKLRLNRVLSTRFILFHVTYFVLSQMILGLRI